MASLNPNNQFATGSIDTSLCAQIDPSLLSAEEFLALDRAVGESKYQELNKLLGRVDTRKCKSLSSIHASSPLARNSISAEDLEADRELSPVAEDDQEWLSRSDRQNQNMFYFANEYVIRRHPGFQHIQG